MLPLPGRIRVEEYVREDGSVPYRAWFGSLDAHAAAKVVVAMVRLSLGNTSNVKWFSGMVAQEEMIDHGTDPRLQADD